MKPVYQCAVEPYSWSFKILCVKCNEGTVMTWCSMNVKSLEYTCNCRKTWTLKQNGQITRKYKARAK